MMELNDGSSFDSPPHKKTFQLAEKPSEHNDHSYVPDALVIQFKQNILILHQQRGIKTIEDCVDSLCSRQLNSE